MANDGQTTSEAIASQISDALTGLIGEASPSALFSEPIKDGDDLIITRCHGSGPVVLGSAPARARAAKTRLALKRAAVAEASPRGVRWQ